MDPSCRSIHYQFTVNHTRNQHQPSKSHLLEMFNPRLQLLVGQYFDIYQLQAYDLGQEKQTNTSPPRKYRRWFDVGPSSATLPQHKTNLGSAFFARLAEHQTGLKCGLLWHWVRQFEGGLLSFVVECSPATWNASLSKCTQRRGRVIMCLTVNSFIDDRNVA